MRHLIAPTLAVAALLSGSCAPSIPNDEDLPPMARADHDLAQACEEEGGELMRVGRLQTERCVVPFSDVGQVCRDGDDCLGDCRAKDAGPNEGTVTGVCAPNDLPFGCNTPIEDGRAGPTLCVD
jgi:hypothetical protein